MFGYRDKRRVKNVIVMSHLVAFAFASLVYLAYKLNWIPLKPEVAVTIVIAIIGWVLAVDGLFLQARLSLRLKLETEALKDIDKAIRKFSTASAMSVTFNNNFVVKPLNLPTGFWFDAARKKFSDVAEANNHTREGFGEIYFALESHEIAIIHLERFYRYLTIIIGDFIEKIEESNTQFLNATGNYNLTEDQYKEAVKAFDWINQSWADISSYLMDFRKLLQNELLGPVFKRELLPRKPKPGFGTTLDKIATQKTVEKMVKDKDEKAMAFKPSGKP